MQKKEFGRYSRSDLRLLASLVKTLDRLLQDFKAEMSAHSDALPTLFTAPYYWAPFYQISFRDLLVCQVQFLDLGPQFKAFAKEADPNKAIIKNLPNLEPGEDVDLDNLKYILGIQMALQGNIRSIGFYSKSLEELTREVASNNDKNDKAFFDAVLIDRTILACPPFADRMARAECQGDEAFFQKLAKQVRMGFPTKKMKHHIPLRICLYELEQEGCLASLSDNEAYELFYKELKLYEVERDPAGSLKKFINRWKIERGT